DFHVTGVQTCALPICKKPEHRTRTPAAARAKSATAKPPPSKTAAGARKQRRPAPAKPKTGCARTTKSPASRISANSDQALGKKRSEERRVGKEGRAER